MANTSPLAHGELIVSDGALIRYRVQGDGPPLILLHGWSQSGAMFHHQLTALSDAFRVIVPDLRAHGTSPTPSGGLRISRLAADLEELMSHLAVSSTHLLGWSMGASVIWSYLDIFGPRRLEKLVFVDQPSMLTIWPHMSPLEVAQCGALFTMKQIEELCVGLQSPQGERMRSDFVRGMVTKSIPAELLQWILAESARTSLDAAASLLWSHCTQDWRDVIVRINRPTLVVCGSVSHVNRESQYFIHSCIPDSVIHEFTADEGGAHFMFLEAPVAFNSVIRKFLAE